MRFRYFTTFIEKYFFEFVYENVYKIEVFVEGRGMEDFLVFILEY